MTVYVNTFFEKRVEQLFDLAQRVEAAFSASGLEYRVVGGLATYLYVEEAEPDAGRLTRDIDIAVRRQDLEKIAAAVEPFELRYRHVAGVDMLVQTGEPTARRAVHLVFTGEKVRPEYSEAVPEIGAGSRIKGIRLIPLADLVRMKLTSFRAKDEAHIKDLDEARLITPDIEALLSEPLRARLAQARARD
uniref:Nucleotidyl transferase AbiEii/AbiGii toxin family protein n=1 Tax=Solibacter usitatus (strain Ellin6076) TaxID=234267 RepID=Q029X4_SOLUE